MIYDERYYKKHLSYSGSQTEKNLTAFRCRTTAAVVAKMPTPPVIVDYGCAHGDYLKAMGGANSKSPLIGVEINPFCVAHAVLSELQVVTPDMFEYFMYAKHSSLPMLFTFWDVLEHLRDPIGLLKRWLPDGFIVSMPCLDAFTGSDIQQWKHYRPLEHLWNFTLQGLKDFLKPLDYHCVLETFEESEYRVDPVLGAKNIMTLGFVKPSYRKES